MIKLLKILLEKEKILVLRILSFSHNAFSLTLYPQSRLLSNLDKQLFENIENIVGKGVTTGNLHVLLFPQCFLPIQKRTCLYFTFILSSALNLDQSYNLLFGKGLKEQFQQFIYHPQNIFYTAQSHILCYSHKSPMTAWQKAVISLRVFYHLFHL